MNDLRNRAQRTLAISKSDGHRQPRNEQIFPRKRRFKPKHRVLARVKSELARIMIHWRERCGEHRRAADVSEYLFQMRGRIESPYAHLNTLFLGQNHESIARFIEFSGDAHEPREVDCERARFRLNQLDLIENIRNI